MSNRFWFYVLDVVEVPAAPGSGKQAEQTVYPLALGLFHHPDGFLNRPQIEQGWSTRQQRPAGHQQDRPGPLGPVQPYFLLAKASAQDV